MCAHHHRPYCISFKTALSFAVMQEARTLWSTISSNPAVKSVVFTSAKDSCFIAGADIFDISSVEDKQTLVPAIEEALMFFLEMKKKGVPMVAAIHGPALGGGLEWGEFVIVVCELTGCRCCVPNLNNSHSLHKCYHKHTKLYGATTESAPTPPQPNWDYPKSNSVSSRDSGELKT